MQRILIVGAGPAGLTMAIELARYGVPVRLIDRSPTPTTTSKALVVWARTLELLDRAGCTSAFLDAGLKAQGALIRTAETVLGHADFANIASSYNFALMLPQCDTERLLAEHLTKLGVTVEREVELTGFAGCENGVEANLRHSDGRTETMPTPWLIGCDGAHSTVRHGIGLDFHGSARGDDWLLADIRLAGRSAAPACNEIVTYLHRDGPLVVFPMPGGRARIVADIGPADASHPRASPILADVQTLIDTRAGGFKVEDPVWLSCFRINERKVADYRHGRTFLVGDAAHIHSPAGGQGMNTGMQDAINLAWKLALAMQSPTLAGLLDSYSPERSAVGAMVLRNARRMTNMATLANPAAQAVRNLVLGFLLGFHSVRNKMTTAMSEIDISYPNSPLSQGHNAGTRLAPADYAGVPPGSGSTPRFALYATSTERGVAMAARFPALLEAAPRLPPTPGRLLIVRPDAYVAFDGADDDDWDNVERYLEMILRKSWQPKS